MYKYVIWDFDGTLFDTYPITVGTFVAELKKLGIEEDYRELMSLARVTLFYLNNRMKVKYGLDQGFLDRTYALAGEEEYRSAKPFPGAAEMCRAVTEAGGENWLYTHRGSSAKTLLVGAGMDILFSDMVISDDGFPSKPAPDAINALVSRNGIDKRDAIMVGDREIDVKAGYNAGIDSCLFLATGYAGTVATYTADSFDVLKPILFNGR